MPLAVGSHTVIAAAVAIAASIALPPCFKISRPMVAASGWVVATTPCLATTGLRWDKKGLGLVRFIRYSFARHDSIK